MRRRLTFVALVGLAYLFVPGKSATSAATAKLLVTPHEGHVGDTLFLSGAGFAPNLQLSLTYECRSAFGYRQSKPGPRTDSHGQFVANSGLRLSGAKPGRCSIKVRVDPREPPVASASYTVLAPLQRLPRCDSQMCLQIKAALVRVSAGIQANVTIQGWPGAVADLVIVNPGSTSEHGRVRLNWDGSATVRMLVPFGLQKGLNARVYVRARLGSVTGSGSAPFLVIPGGR